MNKNVNNVIDIDPDMSFDDFIRLYDSRYYDIINTIIDFGITNGFPTPWFGDDESFSYDTTSLSIDSCHPDYPKGYHPFFRIHIEGYVCDECENHHINHDLRIDLLVHGEEDTCFKYKDGVLIDPDYVNLKGQLDDYSTCIRDWTVNRIDPWGWTDHLE